MGLGPSLSIRQSQQLVLTPQLQQAIKLLPLTTLELAEVLEQEVMENPLLEEIPTQEVMATDAEPAEEPKEPAERDDPMSDIEVDKFFEDVLVMDKDAAIKQNRLALLGAINATFTRVADFRQLAVA